MRFLSNALLLILARLCRFISGLCNNFGLIAILSLILSPVGPHLLLSPSSYGSHHYSGACAYFGSRGIVYRHYASCPLLRIIETRERS